MTPLGPRRYEWRVRRVIVLLLVGTATAFSCADQTRDTADDQPTEQPAEQTQSAQFDCLEVGQAFRDAIGVEKAAATVDTRTQTESGLGSEGGRVWYVSDAQGATWVTGHDPSDESDLGLILPLNDSARSSSEVGADAQVGAPAYNGAQDSDAAAVKSRDCAAS